MSNWNIARNYPIREALDLIGEQAGPCGNMHPAHVKIRMGAHQSFKVMLDCVKLMVDNYFT